VYVVEAGVPVPHQEVLVLVRVHADLSQQCPPDFLPPIRRQLFAGRQRERTVPDRPGHVGPQLPGHAELGGQLAGRGPYHIPANQNRTLAEQIFG
jgi:hypothetical protein